MNWSDLPSRRASKVVCTRTTFADAISLNISMLYNQIVVVMGEHAFHLLLYIDLRTGNQ